VTHCTFFPYHSEGFCNKRREFFFSQPPSPPLAPALAALPPRPCPSPSPHFVCRGITSNPRLWLGQGWRQGPRRARNADHPRPAHMPHTLHPSQRAGPTPPRLTGLGQGQGKATPHVGQLLWGGGGARGGRVHAI